MTFSNGKLGARVTAATAAEARQRRGVGGGQGARPISVTAQIQLSKKLLKVESSKVLQDYFSNRLYEAYYECRAKKRKRSFLNNKEPGA